MSHVSLRREPYRQASPSQCAAIRVPARTFPEEPGQSIAARSAACGRGLGRLLIPWVAPSSARFSSSRRGQPTDCVRLRPALYGCLWGNRAEAGERRGITGQRRRAPDRQTCWSEALFAGWQVQDSNLRSYTATDLQNVAAHAVTCVVAAPPPNFRTNSPRLRGRSFADLPMSGRGARARSVGRPAGVRHCRVPNCRGWTWTASTTWRRRSEVSDARPRAASLGGSTKAGWLRVNWMRRTSRCGYLSRSATHCSTSTQTSSRSRLGSLNT